MTDHTTEPVSSPKELPAVTESSEAVEQHAKIVETGIATRYWLELLPYPAGSTRSLWLFVNNDWRHLDNPDFGTQVSVQTAFSKSSEHIEVVVWYSEDTIEGLIVKTK